MFSKSRRFDLCHVSCDLKLLRHGNISDYERLGRAVVDGYYNNNV